MFEYDRLALDVAQQFTASSTSPHPGALSDHSTYTSAALNPIDFSSRSPASSNGGYHHQQQHYHMIAMPKAMDGQDEPSRRLSGGSTLSYNEFFDCGASSGYGSPGFAGTPLASPAPNSAQYVAHQLQKMFLDQGFCDGGGANGTNNVSPKTSMIQQHCYPRSQQLGVSPLSGTGSCSVMDDIIYNQHQDHSLIGHGDGLGEVVKISDAWNALTSDFKENEAQRDEFEDFCATVVSSPTHFQSNHSINNGINNQKKHFPSTPIFIQQPVALKPNVQHKTSTSSTGSVASTVAKREQEEEEAVAVEDGFSPTEIAQFAQLLCSPKKAPPTRYQCHICYQTGHYISDCPLRFNSPYEELTPYQGRKKCYGEFQCQQCKRKWTSQNSVANEAQSCIKCHVPVFPHKQLPVDKAVALGLVKTQRVLPTKISPIGHGRPESSLSHHAGGATPIGVGGGCLGFPQDC